MRERLATEREGAVERGGLDARRPVVRAPPTPREKRKARRMSRRAREKLLKDKKHRRVRAEYDAVPS